MTAITLIYAMVTSLITAAACIVVLWRSRLALRKMTRGTWVMIRVSMYLLACGALAELVCVGLYGRIPGLQEALFACGAAFLMVSERRIRLLHNPEERHHEAADPPHA